MQDQLNKYLFQDLSIKIHTVDLNQTWKHALEYQHYPKAIQNILGELSAAAVLLASNIKFEGSLVLQLQGNGPVSLIVVECDSDLRLRCTAKLRQEFAIPDNANLQNLLNADGAGRFVVILDFKNRKPGQQAYQGIVSLNGRSVAEVLEQYMKDSEQLDTLLTLASNPHQTKGLLIQKLPLTGGKQVSVEKAQENWEKAQHFIKTVNYDEQLNTTSKDLVHRLFWEDNLLLDEAPKKIQWHCSCTRERVITMLQNLGVQEIDSIIEEKGAVIVHCDFCGKPYNFDPIEAAQLFIKPEQQPSSDDNKTSH